MFVGREERKTNREDIKIATHKNPYVHHFAGVRQILALFDTKTKWRL
jgi:hypothetical protein